MGVKSLAQAYKTRFGEEIKDLYDAEKRLVRALLKMVKAASSEELGNALLEHLEVTRAQVERLEQIFALLDVSAKAKPCTGMIGIIKGEAALQNTGDHVLTDLAIISAAQRVERYEMDAYASVRAMAELIGNPDIAELLNQTWEEEREADEFLTTLAELIGRPETNIKGKAAYSGTP